jgi:hypothetical protein
LRQGVPEEYLSDFGEKSFLGNNLALSASAIALT